MHMQQARRWCLKRKIQMRWSSSAERVAVCWWASLACTVYVLLWADSFCLCTQTPLSRPLKHVLMRFPLDFTRGLSYHGKCWILILTTSFMAANVLAGALSCCATLVARLTIGDSLSNIRNIDAQQNTSKVSARVCLAHSGRSGLYCGLLGIELGWRCDRGTTENMETAT